MTWKYVGEKDKPIRTHSGVEIASGFTRIVSGERGCYVEFSFDQLNPCSLNPELQEPHYYYTENRTIDGIMVYVQKKKVNYADYKPGMWYVSPGSLKGFEHV